MVLVTPGERTRYRALLRALKRDAHCLRSPPWRPPSRRRGGASRWRSAWTKSRTPGSATRRMPSGAGPTPPSSASSLTRTRTRTRTPCWCSTPRTRRPKPRWRRRRTGRSRGRRRGRRARQPRRGGEILRVRVGLGLGGFRRLARMAELVDAGVRPGRPGLGRAPGRAQAAGQGGGKAPRRPRGAPGRRPSASKPSARAWRARGIPRGARARREWRARAREERHTRVARRARDGRHEGCVRGGHAEGGRRLPRASARRREAPPGKNENAPRAPLETPGDFFF